MSFTKWDFVQGLETMKFTGLENSEFLKINGSAYLRIL